MEKFNFCLLNKEDISEMAEIESKYFEGYERAFTKDFLDKWYNINNKMYYGVKNGNKIICFTIFVPLTEKLHDRLLKGEVSDLYDFSPDEVCPNNNSKYFYLADICVNELKSGISMVATGLLIKNIIKIYKDQVEFVTTSPITKNGLKITEHMGFEKVSEQLFNGEKYDVYMLDVDQKINHSGGKKI